MEQPIISPIPAELLKSELTPDKQLRMTNKSNNEIYIVTAHNAPNVIKEIGRLREIAFREAGGGTGKELDLDEFDICENCYKQLIVWNPEAEEILGGYRYLEGTEWELDDKGQPKLATSHMFHFSQKFIDEYLPHVLELGRNFVAPAYQSSKNGAKSIFALDNLWDGLVALIMKNQNLLYFFGKITIYPSYDHISRDLIYHFLWKHYGDKDELVRPWDDLAVMPDSDPELMNLIVKRDDLAEDYKLLREAARLRGVNVPPNVTAYISITSEMLMFGTAVNRLMHNIEDTAVLIPFDTIYHEKKMRHIGAYLRFVNARKRKKEDPNVPETENEKIENWLIKRHRKVMRLLKKVSRK